MQTILGAKGVIARELAKNLTQYTDKIRLVSRNPEKVNATDELLKADVTDFRQTLDAVKGSEVVYLTVGLKYDIKVWSELWPEIMTNVIEACKESNAKLVFFDNVYSYGKVEGVMTEETAYNPSSKKGEIRVKIAEQLMSETRNGNLQALIARAADFYGPNSPYSFPEILIFNNLKKGKKAQILISADKKHSYSYTPDAGKATAMLGNTESAYNQVWHVPTDRNILTGKEFVEIAAEAMNTKPDYTILNKWMLKSLGLFITEMKEIAEMTYQYDSDYIFDSSKFNNEFHYQPVSYRQGIKETAAGLL